MNYYPTSQTWNSPLHKTSGTACDPWQALARELASSHATAAQDAHLDSIARGNG